MAVYPYELSELLESSDYSSDAEYNEWVEARRPQRSNVPTARRGGNVPARPDPGYATKAELTATANRLDEKLAVNSTAIKTVESRFNGVAADHARLKTEVSKLQGGLNDVRNMSMLMPLLTTQSTRDVTASANGLVAGDKVVVDSGDSFSRMLPLLMFSGSFGGTTSGGGTPQGGGMFGGGDSGGIMLLAMMMAMKK